MRYQLKLKTTVQMRKYSDESQTSVNSIVTILRVKMRRFCTENCMREIYY